MLSPESLCLPRASYRRGRQKSPPNMAAAGPTGPFFALSSLGMGENILGGPPGEVEPGAIGQEPEAGGSQLLASLPG